MSSESRKDGTEFFCDLCGDVIEPPRLGRGSAPRNFQESWEEAKEAGWRAVKSGEHWLHRCPSCA
jgi:hypothetical protein